MGRSILVTGGAGFIGANLVRLLLDRGDAVTVIDDLSTGRRGNLDGLSVDLVEGDILDAEVVDRVARGRDAVVHLAAQAGVPASLADPKRDCEVNVMGTLNLLEASRAAGVPRFVFASSNAPLGKQRPPATETKAPLPVSPYGASKLAGEGYCLAYNGSWGLGTLALRFANVYGPFSSHKTSVVARFIADGMAKGRITIEGDGRQTRDFVHVRDLCRAIVLAIDSDAGGQVLQIATGVETAIAELGRLVQGAVGGNVTIDHRPARRGDVRRNYSSISRARRVLGWQPTVELPDGLRETVEWYRAHDAPT